MKSRCLKKVFALVLDEQVPFLAKEIAGRVDGLLAESARRNVLAGVANERSVVLALVQLSDLIEYVTEVGAAPLASEAGSERPLCNERKVLLVVRSRILAILESLGVTPMERGVTQVDYARHEVVQAVPTNDPHLDGRIAEVIRAGYVADGRVLRPMMVTVHTLARNREPIPSQTTNKE